MKLRRRQKPRRQRQTERRLPQAFGQTHAGPHWHSGPQAQELGAVCATEAWQPQRQPAPGQVVQLQETCWLVFMMAFLLWDRRRDVFDGCTLGAAAEPGHADETNGRLAYGSGLADRPSGRAIVGSLAIESHRRGAPEDTVRARLLTLGGPISTLGRM